MLLSSAAPTAAPDALASRCQGEAASMEVLPDRVREFGPLHPLATRAFDALQQGDAAEAVRLARTLEPLAAAVRDEPTLRYALFVRGRALIELGRPWEAADVAARLAQRTSTDAQPFWRAKALGVRAMALRSTGVHHDVIDLLAEIWVLVGQPDGRVYNQVSAAVMMGNALRRVELYEQSDALLSDLWRVVADDIVPTVVIDSARTLADWALHLSLVQHRDAGRMYARLASRAALLRRVAPRSDWSGLLGFADCFEAMARLGLGDVAGAAALTTVPQGWDGPRRGTPEWLMSTYVTGVVACIGGRYSAGTAALHDVQETAEALGNDLWVSAADEALIGASVDQYGPHPALAYSRHMFRRAAARWTTQHADRFDAVRTRIRLHELLAERDQATELSHVDALTGVGNRRALQARIDAAQGPLTALFVDVDDFKAVNDAHSHVTGDAVLVEVAALLGRSTGSGDVLTRFGGDEFVLVLDETPPEEPGLDETARDEADVRRAGAAVRRAEQIVAGVRDHDWDRIAPGLAVTVSVGLARTADGEDLLGTLSEAVRAAKRDGRDRHMAAVGTHTI
jgi:diguanylate cyclase (GGDEF)-like protein